MTTAPARSDPGADSQLGLDIRRRADVSSRRPVLLAFTTALAWLLAGSLFGDVASLKLHLPDWLVTHGWLTFGRIRVAHLSAMIYGWASLAMLGVSLWMIPRLVHAPLRYGRLAELGIWLWNIGVLLGVGAVLAGRTDGLEWLEMPRYMADPWLVVGGGMVGVALLVTLMVREVDHLYVSVWYIMAAYVWFPVIFLVGNWPTFTGVESAATNWFYAHNTLGLWLTAICLGAVYYFIPKVLGRPIHSYQLSLLGFWSLAFFYALNGMHHLVGGPLPTWMITTSIVASVLMLIPVLAVAVNHHMTMVGRFGALRYSPTLRFVVPGAIAYTAVSLQGMFTALREVNRVTHFTQWTIAHSHVGVYAFVTFVLFGSIYYIMPRLTGREWPSARLIHGHESEEMVRRVYARLGKSRHRADAPEFRPAQWFEEVGGQLVPKQAGVRGYPPETRVLKLGVRDPVLAHFSGTFALPQTVSPYGSVAQLDRALASGADESAADSAK